MPFLKNSNGIIFISLLSVVLSGLVGCRTIPCLERTKPGSWPLSRIIQWSAEKRDRLQQLKAYTRITLTQRDKKEAFDAFLFLNRNGEGRLDALGPWRSPLFYLVFNHEYVYLYIIGEQRLYWGQNRPSSLYRLTGLPLDIALFFDSLVGNLPESLQKCSLSSTEKGSHSFFCRVNSNTNMYFSAKLQLKDFPIIQEMNWNGDTLYDHFRIHYTDIIESQGYALPKEIHFFWTDGREVHIHMKGLKLNQPIPPETFRPDPNWFQGEVIDLADLENNTKGIWTEE